MSEHAILSPSSAARWLVCPGSVALTAGMPEDASEYRDQGTAAHELASMCLTEGKSAHAYHGRRIEVKKFATIEVDDEMVDEVNKYLGVIKALAANGELLIEQRVPIGHVTGEDGAEGTADAIVLDFNENEIIVVDLKYGKGVRVDAENNPQGMLYALGALKKYEALHDWASVRIVIHQPRLDHVSEWTISVGELNAWSFSVVQVAAAATYLPSAPLVPGDHCSSTFCKARATCPALAKWVQGNVGADFNTIVDFNALPFAPDDKEAFPPAQLSVSMKAVELIEDWCRAVRAKVESELFAGHDVPGFKLVQGKRGNRAWNDDDAVEKLMKSMRLKQEQMYSFKLISPTQAEKLLKSTPKRWARVQPCITQAEGKASVAAITDPRPVYSVASDFSAVPSLEELVS